jgi:hypothetical protein
MHTKRVVLVVAGNLTVIVRQGGNVAPGITVQVPTVVRNYKLQPMDIFYNIVPTSVKGNLITQPDLRHVALGFPHVVP